MKKLLILFVLCLSVCLLFTAVACDKENNEDTGVVEPTDGDKLPPPDELEEQHQYSGEYRIEDETHGQFCYIHNVIENAEPHTFVTTD